MKSTSLINGRYGMGLSKEQIQVEFLRSVHQLAHKKINAFEAGALPFPIDPQGRVLIVVPSTDIRQSMSQDTRQELDNIGHPIQKSVTVSVDLRSTKFSSEYANQLRTRLPDSKADAIIKAYHGVPQSRVISLQQETYFHAHLIGQMLEKAIEASGKEMPENFEKGLDNALMVLNKAVLAYHAKASEKAYDKATSLFNSHLDHPRFKNTLNKELDKARKKLLPDIAKVVRRSLIKETGFLFDRDVVAHLTKQLAESTSATNNDVVHIDYGMGSISFIGGSSHTAHHAAHGATSTADRLMYSHFIEQEDNTVNIQPLSHHQQVRVPSLALKKKSQLADDAQHSEHFNFDRAVVADVVEKIKHLQKKYNLGARTVETTSTGVLPNAFVYNLFTTLNNTSIAGIIDERSNKQTQSAIHILQAAHNYNRTNQEKPLCLVQNIAVNGWGHALSISKSNPAVVNEAAIMTQLASLHTIFDAMGNRTQQDKIKKIFDGYVKFLNSQEKYFYTFAKKNRLLIDLESLSKQMAIAPPSPMRLEKFQGFEWQHKSFTDNARKSLAQAFKDKAYEHHENGFTYQALSVFCEKSSIAGCKSANERAQAVFGRVAILDFISIPENKRNKLIDGYITNTSEALRIIKLCQQLEISIHNRNFESLRPSLDALYESLNIEGFQSIISLLDQGGHAKLQTTQRINLNTNNAETVLVHTANASKWQCHKGLYQNVAKEFLGKEKFSLSAAIKDTIKNVAIVGAGSGLIGALAFGTLTALTFFGIIGIALPPVGAAIAISVASLTAATAAVSLLKGAYKKYQSGKHATSARFTSILAENKAKIDLDTSESGVSNKAIHLKGNSTKVAISKLGRAEPTTHANISPSGRYKKLFQTAKQSDSIASDESPSPDKP